MYKKTQLIIYLIIFYAFNINAGISIYDLKCEYMDNPIGLDEKTPRFSWKLKSDEDGKYQKAYQIKVELIVLNGNSNREIVWNSGTINSSTIPAIYSGPELNSFSRYHWRVRVLDNRDQWSEWSENSCFVTGMMSKNDWKGSWISDGEGLSGNSKDEKRAPYFRKEFKVEKPIRSARVYIAAAGLYELSINGKRVGDHILDPMFTRFDHRNLYVSYDISNLIQAGDNAVGVLLGNGWYNHQSIAVWYFDRAPWRDRPAFCLDLLITYVDGSVETIVTGEDWKTSFGPLVFNSIYTGEHYDARLDNKGWSTPGYNVSDWKRTIIRSSPSKKIKAQILHPIRYTDELRPVEVKKIDDYTWFYNFGRNISGTTRLKVKGSEGTILHLKHGEVLTEFGRIDMSNIDGHYRSADDTDPFQTDIYILKGSDDFEEFTPKFNYKGFQYVEVTSSTPLELSSDNLIAYFIHSDVPTIGNIRTSSDIVNKMWNASNNSYLSNLLGYPTDCPHREKNGWTGDAHIAIEVGLYNFDAITIYEKWIADHWDEQQPNGVLPAIIPSSGWGYHWANGLDWTSSLTIIPWNLHLFYGDIRLLKRGYDNIKRYIDHVNKKHPTGLTDWGLGDWVPVKSRTPVEFSSSIYYYVDTNILSKTAKLLGETDDYKKYSALASKIKCAINSKYLNYDTGVYGSGLQTEQSMALFWDIVPSDLKEKVTNILVKRVISDNKHIDVGLLGSKTILNALSENGYPQLAWEVASQENYPSWGWWIKNGATTFYENWSVEKEKTNSMNHIMFGEINAWFYKGLGGIFPDEENPGFKSFILKPNFVEGLNQFEATHDSPYGQIVSGWKRKGRNITYNVSVPSNSKAILYLNDIYTVLNFKSLVNNPLIKIEETSDNKYQIELQSGIYLFEIKKDKI